MLWYCLKCRKNTESKSAKMAKANKLKLILSSKDVVCDFKNFRFIKQEARELLSTIGSKQPLNNIPPYGVFFALKVKNKWNSKQVFVSKI